MKMEHGVKTGDAVEKKKPSSGTERQKERIGGGYKIWGICRVIPAHVSERTKAKGLSKLCS